MSVVKADMTVLQTVLDSHKLTVPFPHKKQFMLQRIDPSDDGGDHIMVRCSLTVAYRQ